MRNYSNNMGYGSDESMLKCMEKTLDIVSKNPVLSAGVACMAAALATLVVTKGTGFALALPMISAGASLITLYCSGKSLAYVAEKVAWPIITAIAGAMLAGFQALGNAMSQTSTRSTSDFKKTHQENKHTPINTMTNLMDTVIPEPPRKSKKI